ncbi:Spindle assembly abnormal protein 4 [Toxocara canis]|uniref:Spindle assembly abnormal protein 4 n=1 Tax=Toxocara canis TaxID=6265 RepID=A0A0B2VDZ6_TOXCA|nr:Spindle assembly abnormal protein 4 [Toxocara canis]
MENGKKPKKPFLRKGDGVTGRLMSKIHYPQLRVHSLSMSSPESNDDDLDVPPSLAPGLDFGSDTNMNGVVSRAHVSELSERSSNGCIRSGSSSSHITTQENRQSSSRPLTGTTDSGCPEDPAYLLSPVLTDNLASVVRDVTTDAEAGSQVSHGPLCSPLAYESGGGQSVVYDVSDYPESATSVTDINRRKGRTDAGAPTKAHSEISSVSGRSPSVVDDITSRDQNEAVPTPPSANVAQISTNEVNKANTSVGNSTAEFEHLESRVKEFLSPEGAGGAASNSSHSTDGTRSKHWRTVIRDFRKEAAKDNEFPSQTITPNSGISSTTPSEGEKSTPKALEYGETALLEDTRMRIRQMNSERKRRSSVSSASSLGLRPMRSVFPSIFDKHAKRRGPAVPPSQTTLRHPASSSTSESSGALFGKEKRPNGMRSGVEKTVRRPHLWHSQSTPLLEKSFDEESPGGRLAREVIGRDILNSPFMPPEIPRITVPAVSAVEGFANAEAVHLAKQLRDLIAYLDIVSEEHRRKFTEFEEIYDTLMDENEELHRKVKDLNATVGRLEEADKLRNETLAMLKESERSRNADLERLKKENALLLRKQRMKQDDESTIVKLCREQIDELKKSKRELERQKIDQRAQMRKLDTTIKEKDKKIEEIIAEKERLEKRFKALSDEQAKRRGRSAEESMASAAMERASNKPPVSMATKRIGGMTITSGLPGKTLSMRTGKENIAPSSGRTLATLPEESTDTMTDSGEGTMLMESSHDSNSPVPGANHAKSVRWNEPLETALFSPPSFTHSSANSPDANEPNADMKITRMEENLVGHASLFESGKGDFAVYTRTHCGCSYYEYSNTDTRWVHPSKKYQVNYYGQVGATTVQIEDNMLLVRHFLNGQLEIYRRSGEVTLVTPNGRRTEVLRDQNGFFRTEIYELDGQVRVIGIDNCETIKKATATSCYRMDGSYVSRVDSDESYEWRAVDYIIRRFKGGDVKVRLTLIDTSITMLCCDVGTVKHLNKPTHCAKKYCVEWGTVARNRSRQAAAAM